MRRNWKLLNVPWVAATCVSLVAHGFAAPSSSIPPEFVALKKNQPYVTEFFPSARYPSTWPSPAALLGSDVGHAPASLDQAEKCLAAWTRDNPRCRVVEYARTARGHPCRVVFVSAPANIARLDEIRDGWAQLADARKGSVEEVDRLAATLTPVAWVSFGVHNDETSAVDAGLALLHHLAGATDTATETLLRDTVVMLALDLNPDGRENFDTGWKLNRGLRPDWDEQSLRSWRGGWDQGRHNHYYFDLNRDWLHATQPEMQGVLKLLQDWHPLLFSDLHEMGTQDTYLFSPPREPRNANLPRHRQKWMDRFAGRKAEAFDGLGMKYYLGEWLESFYPGYGESYGSYRGAVAILNEARKAGPYGMREANGQYYPYRKVVHQHVAGVMRDLHTLRESRQELVADFLAERREAVAPTGRFGHRTFAVLPTANHSRLDAFVAICRRHGFELHRASGAFIADGRDQLGVRQRWDVPVGTLLIGNSQPEAHLIAALFEFDATLPPEFLAEERATNLRHHRTKLDHTTAWNLTMLFGLPALELSQSLPSDATPWNERARQASPEIRSTAEIGWIADGADDAVLPFAAQLMAQGIAVRSITEAGSFANHSYSSGSIAVLQGDNVRRLDVRDIATQAAAELGLKVAPISTGMGLDNAPDWGGQRFALLQRPRVALVEARTSENDSHQTEFGSMWHFLDTKLGLETARLSLSRLTRIDLRRYNIIVLPAIEEGDITEPIREALWQWTNNGGTLVAVGQSVTAFTRGAWIKAGLRVLAADNWTSPEFAEAVLVERFADDAASAGRKFADLPALQPTALLQQAPTAISGELGRRYFDSISRFIPIDASLILAGRVDSSHWLASGTPRILPIDWNAGSPVLVTASPDTAVIRFGAWIDDARTMPHRLGWSVLPPRLGLQLRMSGHLWSEADGILANSVYLARSAIGRGQLIAFASPPSWRGSRPGQLRLFGNVIIYGPGLGAHTAIIP